MFEISPAHDRTRTETTNKGQDSAWKVPGPLGCWNALLIDRHGVYIIVVQGGAPANELFVLHVAGDHELSTPS